MKLLCIIFIAIYCVFFLSNVSDCGMVCKHKEFNKLEVIVCPPAENKRPELRYCCINNGLLSCCDYNDYYQRHFGPSLSTILAIVITNCLLGAILLCWCCRRFYKKGTQADNKKLCIKSNNSNIG